MQHCIIYFFCLKCTVWVSITNNVMTRITDLYISEHNRLRHLISESFKKLAKYLQWLKYVK
jgi:hypothetical protein